MKLHIPLITERFLLQTRPKVEGHEMPLTRSKLGGRLKHPPTCVYGGNLCAASEACTRARRQLRAGTRGPFTNINSILSWKLDFTKLGSREHCRFVRTSKLLALYRDLTVSRCVWMVTNDWDRQTDGSADGRTGRQLLGHRDGWIDRQQTDKQTHRQGY